MEHAKSTMQYTPVKPVKTEKESIHDVHVFAALEKIMLEQAEQEKDLDRGYIFDHAEFMESLDHIVQDQLSAIRGDKIALTELADRFNRWFAFCDAVVNLGVSCVYNQRFAANNDYEKLFTGLRVNASFSTTYLKPRGIVVEFRHKSDEAAKSFPWLAMPCLVVKGNDGVEHEIAITPTTNASVWWLDILASFHGSYNWTMEPHASYIGTDENGKPVIDMSYDHHVDSPFADDEMPPVDLQTEDQLPVTAEEEEAFKAIPETTEAPKPQYVMKELRDKDGNFIGHSTFPTLTPEDWKNMPEIKGVHLKTSNVPKDWTPPKSWDRHNSPVEQKGFKAWLNKWTLKVLSIFSGK